MKLSQAVSDRTGAQVHLECEHLVQDARRLHPDLAADRGHEREHWPVFVPPFDPDDIVAGPTSRVGVQAAEAAAWSSACSSSSSTPSWSPSRPARQLPDLAVNEVAISMTLETMGHEHAAEAFQTLVDAGYRVER